MKNKVDNNEKSKDNKNESDNMKEEKDANGIGFKKEVAENGKEVTITP